MICSVKRCILSETCVVEGCYQSIRSHKIHADVDSCWDRANPSAAEKGDRNTANVIKMIILSLLDLSNCRNLFCSLMWNLHVHKIAIINK